MLSGFQIFVSFGEAKIDYIYYFSPFFFANHEVVCLDVSVYEALAVYLFEAGDDLYSNVESGG